MIGRLQRVLRIARWEVAGGVAGIDRRTAALGLAALLLAGTAAGAGAAAGGVALDRDVYRVGIAADDPYRTAVAAEPALDARPPDRAALNRGELDVLVRGSRDGVTVLVRETAKGRAAAATFREAVRAENERRMAAEPNASAAYPVVVTLRYVPQSGTAAAGVGDAIAAGEGNNDGASDTATDGGTGGGSGDIDGSEVGSGSTGDGDESVTRPTSQPRSDETGPAAAIGDALAGGGTAASPAALRPPFPFGSLLLAFAFLVPLNFVIQAYGSTILDERVNRRGEPLLVTPASPAEIVTGKTLPYLVGALAATTLIAAAIGGGVVSILAVAPVALAFLAATFVGAMFARSFKELTFVTVAVSVFLTTFAFVPAVFTEVTPVSRISPLTLVVLDLRDAGIGLREFLFATGPVALAAGLLFTLGIGVYREEEMFTQKPVTAKFLDALAVRLSGRRSVAATAALSIPFVFLIELLAVAVLFALPIGLSLPVLLVVIALVEEAAKSAAVYAGYAADLFDRSARTAAGLGVAAGTGFFIGEKATVIVQVVGLPELTLGRAAFAPAGVAGPLALGLLLAPLALHAVTSAVAAFGARDGRGRYLVGLGLATLLHAGYNLGVTRLYV